MSTHTRARTKRQWRHPASRSTSHREDKRRGEARRETDWIGVEAPERASPQRSFGGLTGHEYMHQGETWKRCEKPEEFADYLEVNRKGQTLILYIGAKSDGLARWLDR